MNRDELEGKWSQLKGLIREKWGKLTDNDIETIKGKRDRLVGMIQERYGLTKERAEDEAEIFLEDCGCSSGMVSHHSENRESRM